MRQPMAASGILPRLYFPPRPPTPCSRLPAPPPHAAALLPPAFRAPAAALPHLVTLSLCISQESSLGQEKIHPQHQDRRWRRLSLRLCVRLHLRLLSTEENCRPAKDQASAHYQDPICLHPSSVCGADQAWH